MQNSIFEHVFIFSALKKQFFFSNGKGNKMLKRINKYKQMNRATKKHASEYRFVYDICVNVCDRFFVLLLFLSVFYETHTWASSARRKKNSSSSSLFSQFLFFRLFFCIIFIFPCSNWTLPKGRKKKKMFCFLISLASNQVTKYLPTTKATSYERIPTHKKKIKILWRVWRGGE